MHPRAFKRLLRRAVLLPLLTMATLAAILLLEAADLHRSFQSVQHSDQVILSSRRILKLLIDMETGVRGYLLTREPAFLEPYHEAQKTVDPEFQMLRKMVDDNPSQQDQLDQAYAVYSVWHEQAEKMIAGQRAGRAATGNRENLRENQLMEAIRNEVGVFQSTEEELRDERSRSAQKRWKLVVITCVGLGLGAGIVIGFLTLLHMRELAASFQRWLDDADERTAELAKSEERWVITLQSIGDAVMATDAEGRVTFVNPLAESLLEMSAQDCLGKPVDAIYRLEDEQTGAAVESPVPRAMELNRVVELSSNAVLLGKSGARTPIADSAAPIHDATGRIDGAVLVFRDVTERRNQERERAQALAREQVQRQLAEETVSRLRKLEQLTEATLAHLPMEVMLDLLVRRTAGVLQADAARLLLLNRQTQRLEIRTSLGLKPVSVQIPLGEGLSGAVAQSGQLRIVDDVSVADVQVLDPEVRDGIVSLMLAPLLVEDKVVGVLHVDSKTPRQFTEQEAALLQIVADRVALAIEGKQAEEELCRSKELLENFVREAPVALAMFDRKMCYLNFSERWVKDTGLQRTDLTGRSHYEVFPNMPEHWKELHQRGLAGESLKCEEDWIAPDGAVHTIAWEVHPWGDSGVSTGGVIISFADLTERKLMENALRESEAVLRTVTDQASVGLVMIDMERRYVFANRAYFEVLRQPDENIVGRRVCDVMAHVYDQIKPRLDRALAGERVIYELTMPGQPGGGERYYTVMYEPRRDGGEVIGVIVVIVDITERKVAESHLRQSEQQFRTLANAIPQLAWMADADGHTFWYNQRWYDYTGTRPEQMEGWGWQSVHDPAVLPEVVERWKRSLAAGEIFEMTFPIRGGDGRFRPFLTRVMPLRDSEGRVVRWFGTNTDVSEQKSVEEALRASEERWVTTLQSIGDAVISTDAAGRITFMNPVAQKLTGWTLAEARGADLGTVFNIVQETTRIKPESPVAKVLRLGEVVGLAHHTMLIRRDGREIPIEDSGAPIRGKHDDIEGVVLVFHDVSEQRKIQKAFRESDRLATTGRLAATIAHEIHNPLDVVGNLLFLIQQATQESETQQFSKMALEELQRVTQMTQQMLSFQRESAKPVPVKIQDLLDNVLALYERKILAAQVSVETKFDFDGEIMALPGELRQVIANLVGNAIEAMKGGGGRLLLRAHVSRHQRCGNEGLRVIIADNGRGIPKEIRDRIFDPFFTTKGESGTGLGLWIATGIIEKYGGAMRLRTTTREGRSGTCFSVFIPFRSASSQQAAG